MKKVFVTFFFIAMLTSCLSYHKMDFIVDNYGINYIDSINNAGMPVKLQYPSDAFMVARPYFQKKYGRKYKRFKPYIIGIMDDSLWTVCTNSHYKYILTGRGNYSFNTEIICISRYDGKIKLYKFIRN